MLKDRWFRGRSSKSFTLQWHLTNSCPFHCKHCYDRSNRRELSLHEALKVLDDLQSFCRYRRVGPRISLSGGDPLVYSHFWELYRAIAESHIPVSILGNPIQPAAIRQLIEIHTPLYYQVSLEGLKEHNDSIRGQGQFDMVMTFLKETRRMGLKTHVMLTLTKDNIDQVIPLGEKLRGLTVRFTFNRLASVGEASNLSLPSKEEYERLLIRYLEARHSNPVLGVKDNLFNIIRHRFHRRYFPGCTGFGCGAAFNFVALLPDGEVHACRKYPSLIGNILNENLNAIYHSAEAKKYRKGSAACSICPIRRVCKGCPAVSFGQGLDPLKDCDPFCFISDGEENRMHI
jgi:selenobiotic family peptide radical SAM maturase